jgi:hypothetical protein
MCNGYPEPFLVIIHNYKVEKIHFSLEIQIQSALPFNFPWLWIIMKQTGEYAHFTQWVWINVINLS